MRLPSKSWFILAAIGLIVGVGFRYLYDNASEASVANYLRSGFHGIGIALSGWAVQLYFSSRDSQWVRKWPLVAELVIRSLVMAVVVTAVAIGLEAALNPHPIGSNWLATDLPRIVALAFVISVVAGAVFEMARLVGGRVLINVIIGRYRRPAREQRVLLFLDLAGSTSLAESLGELRTHDLLTRFFYDIDGVITAHNGEVHAYVGDEVIVTWPASENAARRSMACVFAIEDRIRQRADSYLGEFGLVPSFRAGLHVGAVVISECGDSRRQIAYFGDTMNVTARIQEQCKAAGRALLVSGDLLTCAGDGADFVTEALGPTPLRGRQAAVEIFAVRRQEAAGVRGTMHTSA
jgi:class 3 adenylate cyclase